MIYYDSIMSLEKSTDSTKKTARMAGLVYLLLAVTSYFGMLCVPLAREDTAALRRVILRPELSFRLHFISDLVSQVSAVFLVWLLYRLLSPVGKRPAALMSGLFLASVPISICISFNDIAARLLLKESASLSAFTRPRLDGLADVFLNLHIQGVFAVELLWGLWLIPFGFLVFKSRFIPRIFGITLVVSGLAYALHSFLSLLFPGQWPALYQSVTMILRAAGELPIIGWLLIAGVRTADSGVSR